GVGAGAGPGGAPGVDPFEAFRRAQQSRGRTRQWNPGGGVTVEDFDFDTGGNGGQFSDIFEQLFGGRGVGAGVGAGGRQRTRAQREPQRGSDVEYPVTLTFAQAARGTTLPLQIRRGDALESIEVKIPAGVKDGSRIRIKGRGEQIPGGESGDLFIITSVHP